MISMTAKEWVLINIEMGSEGKSITVALWLGFCVQPKSLDNYCWKLEKDLGGLR